MKPVFPLCCLVSVSDVSFAVGDAVPGPDSVTHTPEWASQRHDDG